MAAESQQAPLNKDLWNDLFSEEKNILKPEMVEELYHPTIKSIKIIRYTTATVTEEITIEPVYPFYTVHDLKLAIYKKKDEDQSYVPEFQFLAIPYPTVFGKVPYVATDFYWQSPETITEKKEDIDKGIKIKEPFSFVTSPTVDSRFVDSAGERKALNKQNRKDVLLEELFKKSFFENTPIVLHLFLLRDLLIANPVIQGSQLQHIARIEPLFPDTTPESTGIRLSSERNARFQELYTYFTGKEDLFEKIQSHLPIQIFPEIKSVKLLRFVWPTINKTINLDTIFYERPVSERLPFIRLLPADDVPVSKICIKENSPLPIPNLEDPCLLLQWAKEKNPHEDAEQDYIFGKIKLDPTMAGTQSIYATLQLSPDGTAAIVIQPLKTQKKIDISYLNFSLKVNVWDAIEPFAFSKNKVDIDRANLMASIKIEKSRGRMTSKEIQKRLGMFRAFFQEIPPLQGEEPLIALRYKAVTNFKNETRIEAFLTQLLERKDIEGANKNEIIQERLAEEFSIPRQDARLAFEQYITKRRQVTAVDPETNTFKPTNNSGIDILIFQQAPYFFFHLYNIDSYKNLQRVLTLLSLMISMDQEDSVLPHKEEVAIEQASDQAIPTAARAAQEAAASARPATVVETDEADEDLGDVDFGAFDEEEEEEEEAQQAPRAPQAPIAAVPPPVQAQIPLPASASLTQPTANYFLRKLQAADDSLFLYTKGRPDLKKYVSVCQAPEGRQPLVLDETGYKRMMLEYKDDIDRNEIRILTYGYEKALVSEEKAPLKRYETEEETEDHIFSVLKYGSDIANQNYYLCSEFYCLRDQLLLRKDQFLEAGTFRENADAEFKGKARAAGHCPFCNGTLLKELDKPGPGQTVYQRPVKKPSAGKRHTHIGFYSKKLHPDGFSLPCCFTMKQTIKSTDDDFRVLNEISKRLARKPELAQVVAPVVEEGQVDEVEEQQEVKVIPNYKSLFNEIYRGEYIVGSEKMPLEIGAKPQIGLLPPSLNQFFNQNTAELVQRVEIAQQLKPKSSGFLRVGVDNRQRYRAESFFAAIAPLSSFPLNSADQVRERLKAQITPKIFIAANHGNLMLEFFDPNFPTFAPSDSILKTFSNKNFGMYNPAQIAYISRIWRSYMNFKGDKQELTIKDKPVQRKSFMNDPDKLKEYRQFAHLLAQPGIFTFRGILLIVLDMAPDGSVSVRCPPFGINDLMNTCDIGILLHKGDIWEPIFYANYLQGTATTQPRGQGFPRFQKAGYAAWPEVLKIKVDEFRNKCQLQSDPIYTGIQQIKEGAKLIPLSKVNIVLKTVLTGIVRDSYNHVVAVTINVNEEEEDEEKKEPIIITLPVVDDGIIYEGVNVYFNWDGYKAPPADEVIKFYTENQEQLSAYPGYQPEYYVIPKKSEKIQAIQLQNGIYIRVSASKETPITLPPPPGGQPELLEYQINKKFALPNDWQIKEGPLLPQEEQIAQIKLIEKEVDLEEIYEHFRLTFSNWLSGPDAGQGMRKSIEDIIMKKAVEYIGGDLPLYQKRERLEILLGPKLQSWLDHTTPPGKGVQPLRRIDCRQLPKDSCPKEMRCAWVAEGETGSCRLHTPSQQTSRMFILRLIDELIRFPLRRQELLKENKRSVRTLIDLDGPNRNGTQYVIPEDAIEWSDLMRMDCRQKTKEIPRFLEEMSEAPAVQKVAASKLPSPKEEKPAPASDLPEALLTILKPNGADLTLYKWSEDEVEPGKEFDELVVRLGGSPDEFEFADDKTSFTREELNKLAIESRKIVVQIDLQKTPPEVYVKLWAGVKEMFVIVITEEGPKVLVQRNTKPRVLNKSLITFVKKYLEVPLPAA
jgi:hypothetical protein